MNYDNLIQSISTTYTTGKSATIQSVNQHLIQTYWSIGQHIVEFEQDGSNYATYRGSLLKRLSQDLKRLHTKGFSVSNLQRMRQFYVLYPKGATLSHLLSWSHIVEFLKIEDRLERSFYEKKTPSNSMWFEKLVRGNACGKVS